MLLLLLIAEGPARAADITDLPPALRGDVAVGWRGGYDVLSLVDQGYDVGSSVEESQALVVRAIFSATSWAALTADLPIDLLHRLSWPDARQLIYDPVLEAGSMAAGDLREGPEALEGSGTEGIGLGLALQPFSEARGNGSTWRVDLGWRRSDPTWLLTGGGGWGASQWRLRAAFSSRRGAAEPYAAVDLLKQGTVTLDLVDAQGEVVTEDAAIHPPDQVTLLAGAEFITMDRPGIGARFVVDLHAQATYVAWSSVPAGTWLGSTLPDTEGLLVTRSDHARIGAGLGIHWQFFRYLGLRLAADGAWITPHRLESPFAVDSGLDSFAVSGQGELVFTLRPPPSPSGSGAPDSASLRATSPL